MIMTLADQYLAQNAGRRYPLADDTQGLADVSLLDSRITVFNSPRGGITVPYLTRISQTTMASKKYKSVTVSLRAGSSTVETLRFDIPFDMAPGVPYTSTALSPMAVGELTVTSSVLAETDTTYDIPFSPSVVSYRAAGVDSVQGIGARDLPKSDVLTGEIVLDNGRNADPYLDGQYIRVDIYKGAGIGEKCQDAASGQTCDKVMFTINGERPGSDGNIKIVGEGGVTVTPVPEENAILISVDSAASDKVAGECEPVC